MWTRSEVHQALAIMSLVLAYVSDVWLWLVVAGIHLIGMGYNLLKEGRT